MAPARIFGIQNTRPDPRFRQTPDSGNKSYFSTSAQGGGGQYIVSVEELDLLIVATAHDNDNTTLQIIAERILPAFAQDE